MFMTKRLISRIIENVTPYRGTAARRDPMKSYSQHSAQIVNLENYPFITQRNIVNFPMGQP